jgi:DNA helicase-2/ATP-dependent DNA helicase PcrA
VARRRKKSENLDQLQLPFGMDMEKEAPAKVSPPVPASEVAKAVPTKPEVRKPLASRLLAPARPAVPVRSPGLPPSPSAGAPSCPEGAKAKGGATTSCPPAPASDGGVEVNIADAFLTDQQRRAATHRGSHALVLAGPGTGKTRTLVERFVMLVRSGVAAEDIFVATFTTKAAEELRDRIQSRLRAERLPGRARFVGTFHSLCLKVLRQFAAEADLDPQFKVLDGSDLNAFVKSLCPQWKPCDGELTDIIAGWKDRLVPPSLAREQAMEAQVASQIVAADCYIAYQAELARTGTCDFADLISRTATLLERAGDGAAWFRQRFQHLLLDEFQDVNALQMRFLGIAGRQAEVWAVADDDQALYGWRGADVHFCLDFSIYFPGAATFILDRNYRCPPLVVKAANVLIANNLHRREKTLTAERGRGAADALLIRTFARDIEEASWIAQQVKAFLASGHRAGQVAVLVRSLSLVAPLQRALENEGVPVNLKGNAGYWDLPEVRAYVSLLRLVEGKSQAVPTGDGPRSKAFQEFLGVHRGAPLPMVAYQAAAVIADHAPSGLDAERGATWGENLRQCAEEAAALGSYGAFFRYVAANQGKEAGDGRDGVPIMTLHASKGLEWDMAFIAGCEASLLPHCRSRDQEEERRLFYVGVTRVRSVLVLTHARQRFGKPQMPSPFLYELERGIDPTLGTFRWQGKAQGKVMPEVVVERVIDASKEPPLPVTSINGEDAPVSLADLNDAVMSELEALDGAGGIELPVIDFDIPGRLRKGRKGDRKTVIGGFTVYRRRGGRSLISPDEQG